MWRSRLIKELLWNCPDIGNIQPSRLHSFGPTWSWLSVSTPVRLSGTIFRLSPFGFVAKNLHVNTDNHVYVRLQAPLLAYSLMKSPTGSAFSRVANENISEAIVHEIRDG